MVVIVKTYSLLHRSVIHHLDQWHLKGTTQGMGKKERTKERKGEGYPSAVLSPWLMEMEMLQRTAQGTQLRLHPAGWPRSTGQCNQNNIKCPALILLLPKRRERR